jgi:two-component system, OmpR family, sensor histidine kinase VicK
MSQGSTDARWPKLLSLAVHELRTPITVVAGYIRMLLKDRAGPITDQQRKLLDEAEKSCARLSALVAEMSDLSNLEGGTASVNRATVDLRTVIQEGIAALPPMTDREVTVELRPGDGAATVQGDATRLRAAVTALMAALRRELVTSDLLIVEVKNGHVNGSPALIVAIGDAEQLPAITSADPSTLSRFDEWRGGSGLSLAVARRVIGQHGGALYAPPGDNKAGAVAVIPIGT